MPNEFDRLFGWLPGVMKRHEDGTAYFDESHPAVQKLKAAIQECRDAGDSEEVIRHHFIRGAIEGLRRIGVIDGR